MKERPILMSGPMVRAILDGRKTVTRRVVKPWEPRIRAAVNAVPDDVDYLPDFTCYRSKCPYGQPGDRLWLREAWQIAGWTDCGDPCIRYAADQAECWPDLPMEATDWAQDQWAALSDPGNYAIDGRAADRRWRPSIHMPRWASRITLEVTGVRVERLQDISDADALAEGVNRTNTSIPGYARQRFESLWESINGPGSWDANPWVWAISFRRIEP